MSVQHPEWSRHAVIYQVNVRQATPEGTLSAFERELPRIARMVQGDSGTQGILWFMPLQPIGREQRKGGEGSYYSVQDYTAVNPAFGTLDDFRRVVAAAHRLGLRVLLDWVANHTAWDHAWTREHPEWYLKDAQGHIHSYVYRADPTDPHCVPEYWTDVVGLDWRQPALWDAMQEAMEFWITETGLDGFRCDVAALVPIAFWERMRPALDALAHDRGGVYLLAEAHEPIHHRAAFDATYDWDLFNQLEAVAAGTATGDALPSWWARRCAHYGPDDHRLIYTANHDSNSWQGSCEELFGTIERFQAMAVLAALLPGVPLLYGGQETFFRQRLAFFERDPIPWDTPPRLEAFYTGLFQLKGRYAALANHADPAHTATEAEAPARLEWLDTGNPLLVAFVRRPPEASGSAGRQGPGPGEALLVWVNLSDQAQRWGPEVSDWAWVPASEQACWASVPAWPPACGSEPDAPGPHGSVPACGWACWPVQPVPKPTSSDRS